MNNGIGSNGWALGRDATRNHDGMLLANPHVPWIGNARFYELQMTIPGQLNVAGPAFTAPRWSSSAIPNAWPGPPPLRTRSVLPSTG